jgi:glyoxylase-like metal-dependent hydrolase (beta-lactamase superfamily II)
MEVKASFDPVTSSLTYVVFDPATRDAVIIDPVLDFDPVSGKLSTVAAEKVAAIVAGHALRVHWIIETHVHADHLTAAQWFKKRLGAGVAVGRRIGEVQALFRPIFDLPASVPGGGAQFDRLLDPAEPLVAGSLRFQIIETPGHTPACITLQCEDAIFTGDVLFMDDQGTARCDFPGGSPETLYRSVHEVLYALPDETRVFPGHDYQPGGRELRWLTTIGRSKAANVHLKQETTREQYVAARSARDATLTPPRLLYPSVQLNLDAGRLPAAHANGRRYLTLPLDGAALE